MVSHNTGRLRALLHWVLERRGVYVSDLPKLLDTNETYIHRWLVSPDWKTHPYTQALTSVFGWDWDRVMEKYAHQLAFADLHPRGYVGAVQGFWQSVRACPVSFEVAVYRHCIGAQVPITTFAAVTTLDPSQLYKLMNCESNLTHLMYERLCRKSPEFTRFAPLPFRCHNSEQRAILQLAVHKEWVTTRGLSYRYKDARYQRVKDPVEHIVSTYRFSAQETYPEYWQQYIGDPKPLHVNKDALGLQLRDALRTTSKTRLDEATR